MPAFITHYLFGVDMYQTLTNKVLKSVLYHNQNAYKLGLQGPDIFFFDLPLIIGPSEFNVGNHMHEHKVSQFFQNYLEKLSTLSGEEHDCGLAYLCGFLGHYSLDAHIHPYIYFRTGYLPDNKDSNASSFRIHGTLESLIDKGLLLERKSFTPSKFYPSKTISLSKKEKSIIANLMNISINQTFHSFLRDTQKDSSITSPSKIKRAINSMKIESLLLHDRTGIKQRNIRVIENLLKQDQLVSSLIIHDKLIDDLDAFNTSKSTWQNPWDTTIQSTDSFYDLYNNASFFYQDILSHMNTYLNNKISGFKDYKLLDRLIEAIGNRSYHSGLDVGNT
ncbi:zinc dependent phospholipase C family protein [Anaerosporobacter sp.]